MSEFEYYIVGLAGRKGVGKDTVANFLSAWFDAIHIKLAAPLKGMLFSHDVNAFNHVSPRTRRKLQELGDFCLQEDDTIFARLAAYQISERIMSEIKFYKHINSDPLVPLLFVISDIRYPHEVKYLRDRFGEKFWVVKIEREVFPDDLSQHRSETSVDDITPDFVVKNDATYTKLFQQVVDIVQKIVGEANFLLMLSATPRLYLSRNISAQVDGEVANTVEWVKGEFQRYNWTVYDPYRTIAEYMDDIAELGLFEAARFVVLQDTMEFNRSNAVLCLMARPSIGCAIEVYAAANMGKPVVVWTNDFAIWSHPFVQTYSKVICDIQEAVDYLLDVTGSKLVKEIITGGVGNV